ncbi:MAG TPA: hypothetical protein VFA38_07150, partial [Nitrospirales bacterium]|nr:hypothetical protein [Nitrospirales bacterium]
KEHLCAFARLHDGDAAITVVPRLIGGLLRQPQQPPFGTDVWDDTWLNLPATLAPPPGSGYRDVLTGRTVDVDLIDGRPVLRAAAIFTDAPVGLLQPLNRNMES